MKAPRLVCVFALTIILIAPLSGCMTAAKQAYYTVRGAAGEFYEIKIVDPHVLASYESIRVEPFTNELGARVPTSVVTEVNEQTPEAVAKAALFVRDGKLLRVTGRVIHFTGRSALIGAVGSVIGGAEECVCRVQLLDGETGDLVGEAVCWSTVKSAVRRGSGELGAGVGKGVAKWIRARLPEDVKEARRREAKPQ